MVGFEDSWPPKNLPRSVYAEAGHDALVVPGGEGLAGAGKSEAGAAARAQREVWLRKAECALKWVMWCES